MRGTRGASQQFMPVHIQAGGWIPGLTLFSSFRPSWPFMPFPSLLELLTGNSCRQRPRHPWEEGSPPSLPGPAGAACAPPAGPHVQCGISHHSTLSLHQNYLGSHIVSLTGWYAGRNLFSASLCHPQHLHFVTWVPSLLSHVQSQPREEKAGLPAASSNGALQNSAFC